ncbi:hypothetical protein [Tuberibacillus sp. Marseille-P3662]|nr:hypothetical protein [Tuberibacillus sp. Marseille-P3662]
MTEKEQRDMNPTAKNEDTNYPDPLDQDDREAMERAENADSRAKKHRK